MEKIQQVASERYPFATQKAHNKFFHNFPFMVEYRVNPHSGKAFPIEVNSMRHEGKSAAYASLLYKVPLYDFFFRGLHFSEELLKKEISKSENTVAAMIFARKPEIDFPAESMDFISWAEIVQGLGEICCSDSEDSEDSQDSGTASTSRCSSGGSSPFANGKNYFFGWTRDYFSGWQGLLQVCEPGWEEQFVMGR